MKTIFNALIGVVFTLALLASNLFAADLLGDALKKGLPEALKAVTPSKGKATGASLDDGTIASGLKDALSVGTKNAVSAVSKMNGYFGSEVIKILLPEKIQKVAELAGKLGFQRQVDDFILSMNRAAEKAAPKAASHFAGAIKAMTIDDARKILSGSDTEATEYFRSKTASKLFEEFKPSVSESMNQVGVTRAYNAMLGKVPDISFANTESLDLDQYVTTKALDGLFYTVGQEEKKIRTNPAARTTELLKKVFSK
jgi:hypothetical protein